MKVWIKVIWLRLPSHDGFYENGYETPGSVKDWKIFDKLSGYQFLNQDSVPWG
jgi:hypothetical protein